MCLKTRGNTILPLLPVAECHLLLAIASAERSGETLGHPWALPGALQFPGILEAEEKYLLLFGFPLNFLNKFPEILCAYSTDWVEVEKCSQYFFKIIFFFRLRAFFPASLLWHCSFAIAKTIGRWIAAGSVCVAEHGRYLLHGNLSHSGETTLWLVISLSFHLQCALQVLFWRLYGQRNVVLVYPFWEWGPHHFTASSTVNWLK